MKEKKKGTRFLSLVIGVFIMAFAIGILFMILAHPRIAAGLSFGLYWTLFTVALLLLVFIFIFFIRYIFIPIGKLEKSLERSESKNINYISDSINKLLHELKMSLEREHSEVILRQQSEYAQLQSQINPHFLYNTLESIRGRAILDDNYKIAEMTEALGKYFRYNIGKDNYEVTLAEELGNIRNYIFIQQYRFQDKFDFRVFNHDDTNTALNCLIPKMSLQPIIENAIYHGMESKLDKGNISVHIELTKERLIILVSDDGGGMDKETLDRLTKKLKESKGIITKDESTFGHNGIALENVNNRLRLLYGENYGIKVSSTLDYGTEVELVIPVIYKK